MCGSIFAWKKRPIVASSECREMAESNYRQQKAMKRILARFFLDCLSTRSYEMKISVSQRIVAVALSCLIFSAASADPIIFDRGLPTANLNNAAGASRSNVAWADNVASTVSIGDNFSLTGNNLVSDIRVWVISRSTAPIANNAFQLWLGDDIGAGTIVTTQAFSTSVVSTTYADSTTYQGSAGDSIAIYQVDFSGLNLLLSGGTYAFGVSGFADPNNSTPFLHASNGPLSGSTQTGSDGIIYGFTSAGLMDTGNGYPWLSIGGWDKASDINVQVFGEQVPEPGSIALVCVGLAGLGFMRRKKESA
jgi:hypothetical protein